MTAKHKRKSKAKAPHKNRRKRSGAVAVAVASHAHNPAPTADVSVAAARDGSALPAAEELESEKYRELKPHLTEALCRFVAHGRPLRGFTSYLLHRCGAELAPYLQRFYGEIAGGELRIEGLEPAHSDSRETIDPEERQRMIAEAAYFRAQQRDFEGDPSNDWKEAEQEVDRQLARLMAGA